MSGQRFEELDRISGMDHARLKHGRIETAQAPAEGSMVARIVDCFLDGGAVDVEASARFPDFGQFDDGITDAISLAGPQTVAIKATGGDIFT